MHQKETARQRAEALFKPKAPGSRVAAEVAGPVPSPFDSIKRQAALAHAIGKLRRPDRPAPAMLGRTTTDDGQES